jgi:hypothetical protein
MTNPNGKRRRPRRPNQASRFWENDQADLEQAGTLPATTAGGTVSTCRRCALPIVGDTCALTVKIGTAAPSTSEICGPCADSLHRWLTRSQRESSSNSSERQYDRIADRIDADRNRRSGSRRSKPRASEVADSLISKRRSRNSDELDRFESQSRRTILITVAGSILALAGLLVLVGSIFFMTNNAAVTGRR